MNFSFASAPNTPYIPQADGRSTLGGSSGVTGTAGLSVAAAAIHAAAAGSSAGGFVGATRATDPLNDIGSPVNLQYLQYAMSSPFFISDSGPAPLGTMGSPSASSMGMGPRQGPALIVTASESPGMAGRSMVPKLVLSPVLDDSLPGFLDPAEVFTTPKITHLSDVSQKTPDLAMFDDSEAIISALSPRTQTAQAGLSLLAASATAARSPIMGQMFAAPQGYQRSEGPGSPFLNANGVDATLMSQPQNSLAHHLSPPLMDHRFHPPQYNYRQGSASQQFVGGSSAHNSQVLGNTGRLMHKRSLLRQSSGLTNASFHNDLVPQPTESFFAPLDEVCSDSDAIAAAAAAGMGFGGSSRAMAQPLHRQPTAPRLGSQFSPIMGSGTLAHGSMSHDPRSPQRFQSPQPGFPQRSSWTPYQPPPPQPPMRPHAYPVVAPPTHHRQQVLSAPIASNIPGQVFSQMPSFSSSIPLRPTNGNVPPSYAHRGGSLPNDSNDVDDDDDDDDDGDSIDHHQFSPGASDASDLSLDSQGAGDEPSSKRRRTSGAPTHKRDKQRRFNCDICNRSFARQYNLKTHRMTHFPEVQASRPFKCPHCIKSFTRKHDLQRHAVLHERTD
ncbi:hypothetical protein H4S07_003196, partial [Coemansia furcata]